VGREIVELVDTHRAASGLKEAESERDRSGRKEQ
jgi:hypothetical protein